MHLLYPSKIDLETFPNIDMLYWTPILVLFLDNGQPFNSRKSHKSITYHFSLMHVLHYNLDKYLFSIISRQRKFNNELTFGHLSINIRPRC